MHVVPLFRDAFRICKASKKSKLSLASLKICFQGESSLTDHESPRYHQSNDTVPPSFNLKIFSWVQTWEISRSVFGVFGWVVMVSFENEKFLQNRTVCFWLFHLTAANISSTSTCVVITIYTTFLLMDWFFSPCPFSQTRPPNSSTFGEWGCLHWAAKNAGTVRREDTRNPFPSSLQNRICPKPLQ